MSNSSRSSPEGRKIKKLCSEMAFYENGGKYNAVAVLDVKKKGT
jgi:hypothetical protein